MIKKYLIFDLDGTLVESMNDTLKICLNYMKKIPNTDLEKAEYILSSNWWMPLIEQLVVIYEWTDTDVEKVKDGIYERLYQNECVYFEWVPEKIKELSKKYKLFLTTWNSTQTAIKYLNTWWILDCFELVYWSEKILKWMDHLNIFKDHCLDDDFFEKSVYIWDWTPDRMYAKHAWIDFIHIWNQKRDRFEIESVVEIDNILKELNN